MIKYLSKTFLILTIFTLDSLLYGTDCVLNDGTEIYIESQQKLDFSKKHPNLTHLTFTPSKSKYHLAKDDLGLGKNVNLKSITAYTSDCQKPISLSYLPNVEFFKAQFLATPLQDLDYLPSVFPSLKTFIFVPYGSSRSKLASIFENISKLEFLENFSLDGWQGPMTFTNQEILALSKIQSLKTLDITLDLEGPLTFDQKALQTLEYLLPNIKIQLHRN